jgi:arsenate reductase-like glutaredoxin family protein
MNNKIKLYTLEGCSNCKKVNISLLEQGIDYEIVDCSSPDCEECDRLEDQINCGRYPIAVINTNNSTIKIHLCDDNKQSSSNIIIVDSVDKFVSTILKYYIY